MNRVGRVKYPLFVISMSTEGARISLGSEGQCQTEWRSREVRLELVDGKELIRINSKIDTLDSSLAFYISPLLFAGGEATT